MRPIAITTGEHRGIGAEVIAKGLRLLRNEIHPHEVVLFGEPGLYSPFRKLLPKLWRVWSESEAQGARWKGPVPGHLNFVVPRVEHIAQESRDAYACGRYIELAVRGCLRGAFSAMTTGPIDKTQLRRGGFNYDGHTEMLQAICGAKSVTMMLASPRMRISLVTVHEPLSKVASKLSSDLIVRCVENTAESLSARFRVKKPVIAILGLNPHASDHGLFGNEEQNIIVPAIALARDRLPGATLEGPFAPDGFFGQWRSRHSRRFDAVVCMYHDQGLIPVKLLDFRNTVNVSLGLPIIRTSVDHGVGYDIAGKNKADPSSFRAALRLARWLARERRA